MFDVLHALVMLAADMFKSQLPFQAENLFARHQLNIFAAGTASSSTAPQ
jgi:hypothetical protein